MDTDHRSTEAAVLLHRSGEEPPPATNDGEPVVRLRLALAADERTSLRGHRRSICGRDIVLQLPRGEALRPGEWLLTADARVQVMVEAASEPQLVVKAADPVTLLQAAYHLGNRHVAVQIGAGELRLLEDQVLADLLQRRGLLVERLCAPFLPEAGAYGSGSGQGHGHHHGTE